MPITSLSPSELPRLIDADEALIDVRTPAEFKAAHVNGATLLPLNEFDAAAYCEAHGKEKAVYILCQSGKRAEMAAEKLSAAGHQEPVVIEGGTAAAIASGIDVVRGAEHVSIERQVRIAAGTLVFTGTLAGIFIHSGFLALPAFVGAGLAFAGITDTCGMGAILAKMPWNR
ncbi:MAG: rhodanese-like domain-containing protein [Verrucomicrobiota bacterium]